MKKRINFLINILIIIIPYIINTFVFFNNSKVEILTILACISCFVTTIIKPKKIYHWFISIILGFSLYHSNPATDGVGCISNFCDGMTIIVLSGIEILAIILALILSLFKKNKKIASILLLFYTICILKLLFE